MHLGDVVNVLLSQNLFLYKYNAMNHETMFWQMRGKFAYIFHGMVLVEICANTIEKGVHLQKSWFTDHSAPELLEWGWLE